MRYVKYLLLILVAFVAVILALANRGPVTLHLLPDWAHGPVTETAAVDLPGAVTLPIYLVVFAAILFGFLIGLVLEMFREREHRRAKRSYEREAKRLDQENRRLAAKAGEDEDDILGLTSR